MRTVLPQTTVPRTPLAQATGWPPTIVRTAALISILGALITGIGWIFDRPRWTDWWGDDISMLFNTALCVLLCGVALLVSRWQDNPLSRRLMRICGVVGATIGGLTILEHLTGINLGIDTLLISRNWGQNAVTSNMRMGPPAATSFLLLGIAIVMTTGSPLTRRNASALTLVPLFIASLSIIGYLLDADQLYGVAKYSGIARQTGVLLAVLGIGVITSVPEFGLTAALRREDLGGEVMRHLLPSVLMIPVMLGWARVMGQEAGWYDTAFGTSTLILLLVVLLFALLWWASSSISKQIKLTEDAHLRLAAIVANTSDAVVGKRMDGTIESWNQGATELYGYAPAEAIGNCITMLVPPDRFEEEDRIQERLRLGEKVEPYETIRWRKDGSEVYVSLTVSPILDAFGNIVGASHIARDITQRIKAEEAMRRSEAELQALADSIPQLAWMAQPDGHIFWYNHQWYEYTGTTLEDMEGWGWQSVHDPEVLPQVLEQWKSCLARGEPFEMEFPLRGVDGRFRWFLTRCRPLCDAEGNVLRWFGTNTDLEEVKQKEHALQQKTQTLELLNNVGQLLGSKLDIDELLQSVTDVATKVSQARFGAFFYNSTDDDGDSMLLYSLSGAPREAFEHFEMPRATPLFEPTFAGTEVVRSDDILADPRYGKMAPHLGMPEGHLEVRSYLAVPVKSGRGTVLGGLFFGHPEVAQFTEATERIIEGIASQAGIAIDNARMYDNLKRAAIEREELLVAERSARSDAERLNTMKDEFLATLSHELRTPLNAILGWAQILTMGEVTDEDFSEGMDAIQRNARAQNLLIEDLLDMSRIISGKFRLEVRRINVTDILSQAVETVRPAAEAKQIELVERLSASDTKIRGDAIRLQQVFWNLLSNAIKFTPREGRVEVVARQDADHLIVEVRDSGIGIPSDLLQHVFERFRQVDSSSSRAFGGLGIGLSIVKNLVEMHGGSVDVQSEGTNQGSTFTVLLPLNPTRSTAVSPDKFKLPEGDNSDDASLLAGLHVLVIDDEIDSRMLLQRLLKEYQATVDVAASAEEAFSRIDMQVPDLIVSDIGMPDMDGYEFIRRLRRRGPHEGGDVPAVALTAFARDEDRERALEAGYEDHLTKPIQTRELAATLSRLHSRA